MECYGENVVLVCRSIHKISLSALSGVEDCEGFCDVKIVYQSGCNKRLSGIDCTTAAQAG